MTCVCVTVRNITQWLIPFPLEQRGQKGKEIWSSKTERGGSHGFMGSSAHMVTCLIQATFWFSSSHCQALVYLQITCFFVFFVARNPQLYTSIPPSSPSSGPSGAVTALSILSTAQVCISLSLLSICCCLDPGRP